MGNNAIKINSSFELTKVMHNLESNNFNFSIINDINFSRINFNEERWLQDINQEFPQNSNIGNNNDLYTYIKVIICIMSIGIILYIIRVIMKCFQLKSKCNFDSNGKKSQRSKIILGLVIQMLNLKRII